MTRVLVNGAATGLLPVTDRGFQYGDGLFETIAIVDGVPLLWERHMARLKRGAERLQIEAPSETLLHTEAATLIANATRAVLKIIVTRGLSQRGYAPDGSGPPTRVLSISSWPDYPEAYTRDGVTVRLCQSRLGIHPALAGIKHLNRLEQVLARSEWRDQCAEGLMLDVEDNVISGTMSNFFIVSDGVLATPDLSQCGVDGIMRGVVLEQATRLALLHRVAKLTLNDIGQAREVFLTNSLIGIWPVRKLEQWEYTIGPITRTLGQTISHARQASFDA